MRLEATYVSTVNYERWHLLLKELSYIPCIYYSEVSRLLDIWAGTSDTSKIGMPVINGHISNLGELINALHHVRRNNCSYTLSDIYGSIDEYKDNADIYSVSKDFLTAEDDNELRTKIMPLLITIMKYHSITGQKFDVDVIKELFSIRRV